MSLAPIWAHDFIGAEIGPAQRISVRFHTLMRWGDLSGMMRILRGLLSEEALGRIRSIGIVQKAPIGGLVATVTLIY